MKSYRVKWEIDVDAETPEDAARQALAAQRRPGTTATVFDVRDFPEDNPANEPDENVLRFDLQEEPTLSPEVAALVKAAKDAETLLMDLLEPDPHDDRGKTPEELYALSSALAPFTDMPEQTVTPSPENVLRAALEMSDPDHESFLDSAADVVAYLWENAQAIGYKAQDGKPCGEPLSSAE